MVAARLVGAGMFGLSVSKIVLLIVIIGAVVFGAKLLRTLTRPKEVPPEASARPVETTTFEVCPRCGAYVDPAHHRCGPGRSAG